MAASRGTRRPKGADTTPATAAGQLAAIGRDVTELRGEVRALTDALAAVLSALTPRPQVKVMGRG